MTLQGKLIRIAYQCRPILTKLLPNKVLRDIKGKLIKNSLKQLNMYRRIPFQANIYPRGLNLIGSIRADTGLGQSCRLIATQIENSGLPFTIYNYEQTSNLEQTDHSFDKKITNTNPYQINLLHINPRELGIALNQMGFSILNGKYNIGFWLWELEEFPDEWCFYFKLLDEIWTPSEFISRTIRKKTTIPVITIPYVVSVPFDSHIYRKDFGLPENTFLFLMAYDNSSIGERKNPFGAIRAFQQAFSPKDRTVGLVIKALHLKQTELKQLKKKCREYENIYILTKPMEKIRFNSLLHCCNALLSLHRAEGFGLVLAEAMYLGKPVIATNWSANTEFMDKETACMIDYDLVTLEKNYGPFLKGQKWADPNIKQAATEMKKLKEQKDYYYTKGKLAQTSIKQLLSSERINKLIVNRVHQITSGG